jgi:hypothetical protein
MTTQIRCEFIGGPKDGQSVEMQAHQCPETLAVKSNGWIAVSHQSLQRFDPDEVIPEPKPSNWHSYVRSVYLRAHELRPTLIYWYMREQLVERCQAVTEGTQCMNEAVAGQVSCTEHPYGIVRQSRFLTSDRRVRPRAARADDRRESR